MFFLLIKGALLLLLLVFVICCCCVIVASTYETIVGKNKTKDKEWVHEKCNTNTPPKQVPKGKPSILKIKFDKAKVAPIKVYEGFWCIYKGDVYILSEENGFPKLKLMEFQDLDEKYGWLEQWNH